MNQKVYLIKEDDPNSGLIINAESDGFVLNEVLDNPIDFLDKNGALGFTRAWATKEVNLLGGNDEDIKNAIRIVIFNQNAYMIQNWIVVQMYNEINMIELFGQLYNVIGSYKGED